jgi:NAD(P)-dependent dehydrogenase (short-subunit alcohol dehydrogenase family)
MRALSGKVAVVTGGTSGIGERIAEVFIEQGANVVVAARRETEGAAPVQRLGVEFVRAEVAKEYDVKAVVDAAVARFGRIDCLVNNPPRPNQSSASPIPTRPHSTPSSPLMCAAFSSG